jgi:DNA-nicking Smr family endonuclease
MTRRLTGEERQLWDRLRRSVQPLRGKEIAEPIEPNVGATAEPPEVSPPPSARSLPRARPGPPIVPLEARLLRRLSRGLTEVDARIDLHGMRQERAYAALAGFLRHAQARGARVVLVVTGKGRVDEGERGVLRRSVPVWLAQRDFRDLVVGFEEASHRHGGAGALYVRLRRRRAGRPAPPAAG